MVAAFAAVVLPSPTGRYAVGTTEWHVVDQARDESFNPGTKREVQVIAYYPASEPGTRRAPYLRVGPIEASAFAALMRAPADAYAGLLDVETHAWIDAPIAKGSAKLPVLVFSHGYTAHASAYAALLEDLASHGFVVISIVHPYETFAAKRADGSIVTTVTSQGTVRPELNAVFTEWRSEDDVSASMTRANNAETELRLLREYLAGLAETTKVLDRWVADTRLVVNDVDAKQSSAPKWLRDRIDMRRFGVFGHSMGGVTAAAYCGHEARCAAGLNLDGSPQYGRLIDERLGRPFLMVYSARPGRERTNDAVYAKAASRYDKVSVANTRHVDFSDMILWGGPLRERGAFGSIEPARAVALTRLITRAFFDQEIRGQASALRRTTANVSELTLTTLR